MAALRTALVALDGSPSARAGLDLARALVEPDATLRLLQVVAATDSEEKARVALEPLAGEVRRDRPAGEVVVEVRTGRPADEILAAAGRVAPDLLVVGALGKSLIERMLLGSVSDRVVERASCSVLVGHAGAGATPRVERVLVAFDLLETSRPALRLGHSLSKRLGVPLEVVHVIDSRGLPLPVTGAIDPGFVDHETRDAVNLAPSVVARELALVGATDAHVDVRVGVPSYELVASARPTDLAVCGTHSRGALARLVMGSTSLHLVRNAPCPVLVVRPEPARP